MIVGNEITYQGLPCISGSFARTVGIEPDTGFIQLLVRNFHLAKFEIPRPMFPFRRDDARGRLKALGEVKGGIIEGATLVLFDCGELRFKTSESEVVIPSVYIQPSGIREVERYVQEVGDTSGPVSRVQIDLIDERAWWSRRGYMYGVFNRRGVDGETLPVTMDPNTGDGWTVEYLMFSAVQSLPSHHASLGAVDIPTDTPVEVTARFDTPVEFITKIAKALDRAVAVNLDYQITLVAEGEGREFEELGIPQSSVISDLRSYEPQYTPEARLYVTGLPTVVERDFEMSGELNMVIRHPATQEFLYWRHALPLYGLVASDLPALGTMPEEDLLERVSRKILKYLKQLQKTGQLDDQFVVKTNVKRPRQQIIDEANYRTSIITRDLFRAFMVRPDDQQFLPLMDELLQREVKSTQSGKKILQGKAAFVIVETSISGEYDPSVDDPTIPSQRVVLFWNSEFGEIFDMGHRGVSLEPRIGVVRFHEPVGPLYDQAGNKLPTSPAEQFRKYGSVNLSKFRRGLPTRLVLRAAHEQRGGRQVRSGLGLIHDIPSKFSGADLREIETPENHYRVAVDRSGNEIELEAAETLYPEVVVLENQRLSVPLPDLGADSHTEERPGEAIREDVTKRASLALREKDFVGGRTIQLVGYYGPAVDGLLQSVSWEASATSARTTLVFGSRSAKLPKGRLSVRDKAVVTKLSRREWTVERTPGSGIPGA